MAGRNTGSRERMQYTRIKRRSPEVTGAPGVYADRDELMRLRFNPFFDYLEERTAEFCEDCRAEGGQP